MLPVMMDPLSNLESGGAMLKQLKQVLDDWKELLKIYVKVEVEEDQVEFIFSLQEYCEEHTLFVNNATHILHMLYEEDILTEEAIRNWASEQEQDVEAAGNPFITAVCILPMYYYLNSCRIYTNPDLLY